MSTKHPVGSYVALKSGGPVCIVVDTKEAYSRVSWIATDGKVQEHTFPDVCLTPINPLNLSFAPTLNP